jgi:hypothetical protein
MPTQRKANRLRLRPTRADERSLQPMARIFNQRCGLATPSPRLRGEGGVRGRCRRRCREDCLPNPFNISQNFVVPETQHAMTMFDEPSVADGVAFVISMLAAIDLNDNTFLSADKIGGVGPDRLPAHKLEPAE